MHSCWKLPKLSSKAAKETISGTKNPEINHTRKKRFLNKMEILSNFMHANQIANSKTKKKGKKKLNLHTTFFPPQQTW